MFIYVGFLVVIDTLHVLPPFTIAHIFLPKLFLSEASKKQFERGNCVTDSNYQQQEHSHSLVSVRPSYAIRNVSFIVEP